MSMITAQSDVSHEDDLSNGYINIIEPEVHKNALTMELLESCSKNFSVPVVFRQMVPLDARVATPEFLEVEVDQKLVWREKSDDSAVAFRNEDGQTDFNYISGRVGTAREFLDSIFVENKDVYAHLGRVSAGFKDLHTYPWGGTIFERIQQAVLEGGWFQIPDWQLSGQVFLGNNTETYAEPSSGAPGSDWHMFPTVNLFVMIAGKKKWMIRPPQAGDHLRDHEELVFPSGGREQPVQSRAYDTLHVESGDLLFNVPFEWHKVVNAKGWSCAAAFRVIDKPYRDLLLSLPAVRANLKLREMSDEYAHLATSLRIASHDPVRMQMALNSAELMICTAARFDFGR